MALAPRCCAPAAADAALAGARRLMLITAAENRAVASMIARRWPGIRAERDGATLGYVVELAGPAATSPVGISGHSSSPPRVP